MKPRHRAPLTDEDWSIWASRHGVFELLRGHALYSVSIESDRKDAALMWLWQQHRAIASVARFDLDALGSRIYFRGEESVVSGADRLT